MRRYLLNALGFQSFCVCICVLRAVRAECNACKCFEFRVLCLCLSAGRACRRVLGLPDLGRKDGKTERRRVVSVCAATVRVCLQGVRVALAGVFPSQLKNERKRERGSEEWDVRLGETEAASVRIRILAYLCPCLNASQERLPLLQQS